MRAEGSYIYTFWFSMTKGNDSGRTESFMQNKRITGSSETFYLLPEIRWNIKESILIVPLLSGEFFVVSGSKCVAEQEVQTKNPL